MTINLKDIESLDQRFRTTFINSLGGFKSLALIGTINSAKQTNLAVFNSLFHLGAHPPLFGFIVRPDSVERHTLSNIRESGYFSVNHVTEAIYRQAHQSSARYPANISEFDATGLHEDYLDHFPAPFVKESPIKIAAQLEQIVDIPLNGTLLIIGKILEVLLPDVAVGVDGFVDLQKAGTITCSGLDAYYTTKKLERLSYAKPDKAPSAIDF